jgi:Glycine rich protein
MGANPAGGFNGGGKGTVGAGASWVGGGGASDVRTLPMSAGVISLNSRLIVAGGGGGAPNAGDAGQSGVAAFARGGSGTQTLEAWVAVRPHD